MFHPWLPLLFSGPPLPRSCPLLGPISLSGLTSALPWAGSLCRTLATHALRPEVALGLAEPRRLCTEAQSRMWWPWAMDGGGRVAFAVLSSPTGIAVGHIYYFLEDVFPNQPGGKRLLLTPSFL